MKIDFYGTYKELSAIVRAPSRLSPAEVSKPQFGELLSSVSPDRQQELKIIDENSGPDLKWKPQIPSGPGPMASLKLGEPSLKLGNLEPVAPLDPPVSDVKEDPPRVKTPAVLGVRRINTQENIQELETSEPKASIRLPNIDSENEFSFLIKSAGEKHGVDPSLSMAVASTESAFNSMAVSKDGPIAREFSSFLIRPGRTYLNVQVGLIHTSHSILNSILIWALVTFATSMTYSVKTASSPIN